jgi:hypothetical protein
MQPKQRVSYDKASHPVTRLATAIGWLSEGTAAAAYEQVIRNLHVNVSSDSGWEVI